MDTRQKRIEETMKYLKAHRLVLYDQDDVPIDLATYPSLTILRGGAKVRIVTDFSCGDLNLNSTLDVDTFAMDSPEDMVRLLPRHARISGADVKDCFPHWLLHPSARRLCGLRVPAEIHSRPDYSPNELCDWEFFKPSTHPRKKRRTGGTDPDGHKREFLAVYLTLPQGISPAPLKCTRILKSILQHVGYS